MTSSKPYTHRITQDPTYSPEPYPVEPPTPRRSTIVSTECDCHTSILKDVNHYLLGKLHEAVCAPPCRTTDPAVPATAELSASTRGSQLIDGSAGITLSTDNGATFGTTPFCEVNAWSAGVSGGIVVETFEVTNPSAYAGIAVNDIIKYEKSGSAPLMHSKIGSFIKNSGNYSSKYWSLLNSYMTEILTTSPPPPGTPSPTAGEIDGGLLPAQSAHSETHYYEIYYGTTWTNAQASGQKGRMYRHAMKPSATNTDPWSWWYIDQYYYPPGYVAGTTDEQVKVYLKRISTFATELSELLHGNPGKWYKQTFAYRWTGLS